MPSKTSRKRVHVHLVSLFSIAAVALVLLNVAAILTPLERVAATNSDNVRGWAWSDTGGWLSMNDLNAGSGGGSYGVDIDDATGLLSGFAWSDNQGWMCFGSSCTVSACANGANAPTGGQPSAGAVAGEIRGWAMFCNLGTDGWVSLHCNGSPTGCSSDYGVTASGVTGQFDGYAWHGLAGPAGWGWIDFSGVTLGGEGDLATCQDGDDNDLDGNIDCADDACYQQPALNCPATETQCALLGRTDCCSNGFDDDLDGDVDCADNNCSADPLCSTEICDNLTDDDSDGDVDCDDDSCSGFASCTPAWIQSQYGNLYAQQGIRGNAPPPGQSNASFCISSGGEITNFTSETGCLEPDTTAFDLPSTGNGYVSNLGRLDVAGILAGRYGQVVNIADGNGVPALLDGKVYVYDRDLQGGACPSGEDFVLDARVFQNAAGEVGRGNGLLVVKGCNIRLTGNLGYQAAGVDQYLRNLASFGVLALTKYVGGVATSGGMVFVDPGVTQIVGLYFSEHAFSSGSTGATFTDVPLKIYGAVVSNDIRLERRFSSPTEPAEDIVFDGRGVVNPPPGTQDITKSLPTVQSVF
jgi:hypothetical protein